jgi:hypothetical protein
MDLPSEHRRACLSEVELAAIHLGEMLDELGLCSALLFGEPFHLADQGIVGELIKRRADGGLMAVVLSTTTG